MKPRRLSTIAANLAFWLLWVFCILLIVPVMLNVPGEADASGLALYLAAFGSVTTYPVVLPVLAVLERHARRQERPACARAVRAATWLAFLVVVAVFAAVVGTAYVHEKSRPVLTQAERFSNSYANAILHRDTAWMNRLMADGASVDHEISDGQTAAITSASFGQWSLVLFLLERGANPDHTDDDGDSVRTLAAEPRNPATRPEDIQALARVREMLRTR